MLVRQALRRLGHLSDQCRRALHIAAVIGNEFRVDTVERVRHADRSDRLDPPTLLPLFERLRRRSVLHRRFLHRLPLHPYQPQLRRRQPVHRRHLRRERQPLNQPWCVPSPVGTRPSVDPPQMSVLPRVRAPC